MATTIIILLLVTAPKLAVSARCPTDYAYLKKIPWDAAVCKGTASDTEGCCTMLLTLFGISVAQHLKSSSHFEFKDTETAEACLAEFRHNISPSLSSELVPRCLNDTSQFVSNPSHCVGIQTLSDWQSLLGATPIDTACKDDIGGLVQCNLCKDAAQKVTVRLAGLGAKNTLKCFYFSCIYAARVVNGLGPDNSNTASCAFGIPLTDSGSRNRNHIAVYTSVNLSVSVVLVIVFVAIFRWIRLRQRRRKRDMEHQEFVDRNMEAIRPNTGALWFSYEYLEVATKCFARSNLIGQGAFGSAYKGILPNGRRIAVKRLHEASCDAYFANEVEIINNIRHRNLVSLRGCCVASNDKTGPQRLLVYDYYPKGSLAEHLTAPMPLSWPQRKNIVLGIAHGLAYLHYGVQPAVYHRDVKPTNILLDHEMNALVTDFGLAKIVQKGAGQTGVTTRVAGTHGYLAPEYALYGHLTDKSDVYSFGVLVLVILSRRPALSYSPEPEDAEDKCDLLITDWAWLLVKAGRCSEVLDGRIRDGVPETVVMRFVKVGILCAHVMVAFRPSMTDALRMLEGDIEIPEIPDRPLPVTHPPVSPFTSLTDSTERSPFTPTACR